MQFSIFLPQEASNRLCPAVLWLSGLTCSEENFTFKAGGQRYAADLGLILIAPDTSPRGLGLPKEDKDYDFGSGAGFYLDAAKRPWSKNYKMYSYITTELHGLILSNFYVDPDRIAISGHSMGGHGALTIGLKNPNVYRSISAFAPIVSPITVPWGRKAFAGYLGDDEKTWEEYDTIKLLKSGLRHKNPLLIDQGKNDQFIEEQLKPELLQSTCKMVGQKLVYRLHPGYDHSYYFISTFIGEHLAFHSENLSK